MNAPGDFSVKDTRLSSRLGAIGIACLLVAALGALREPTQFFRSYLTAYVFWIGMPLGAMAITMTYRLTGGEWGPPIARVLESVARTLPLMAILFIPIVLGISQLYSWARTDAVAADDLLQYKRPYLNPTFFIVRAIVYFAVWIGLSWLLGRSSGEEQSPRGTRRAESFSAPGLVVYFLTVTFAMIDWIMSAEAHWYSTIFGLLFIAVELVQALAFAIAMLGFLAQHPPLSEVTSEQALNDLGNLLLTAVMLWAYMSFSQFLIIWSGNLTTEISWYVRREGGAWSILALLLITCHFALPFALLLSRGFKRNLQKLSRLAAGLVVLGVIDVFWLVAPAFEPQAPRVHWLDLLTFCGLGGIWLAWFWRELGRRPLVAESVVRAKMAEHHGDVFAN
jgi:hypothetical protein